MGGWCFADQKKVNPLGIGVLLGWTLTSSATKSTECPCTTNDIGLMENGSKRWRTVSKAIEEAKSILLCGSTKYWNCRRSRILEQWRNDAEMCTVRHHSLSRVDPGEHNAVRVLKLSKGLSSTTTANLPWGLSRSSVRIWDPHTHARCPTPQRIQQDSSCQI